MILKDSLCCDFAVFIFILCIQSTFAHKLHQRDTTQNGACDPLDIVNGDYNILGSDQEKGTPIPNYVAVNISCHPAFYLYPDNSVNVCINRKWSNHPVPECKPHFPLERKLLSSCDPLDIVNGDYNILGSDHKKGTPIPNYAAVNISCHPNYYLYPDNSVNVCINRKWSNHPVPECRPLLQERKLLLSCDLDIVNGDYNVLGSDHKKGTPIPNYAAVNISCHANYVLYPENSVNNICIDGEWSQPLQECRQLCPPWSSTAVKVACTLDGQEVDCKKPVVDGTVAESICDLFYHHPNDGFPTSKCSRGSWENPLIRCEPECGQLTPTGVTHIIGGHDAERGEFPWHIGLYYINVAKSTYDYQCGGSIITPVVVITAAHCVINYEAEEFYVAAGKFYSNYEATEDDLVQKRQVKEYRIPREYRGFDTSHAADLAVVVIKKAFTLSNVVQPVCVDWNSASEKHQLKSTRYGYVVGWGFIDPGKFQASKTLKQLSVPYIDREECLDAVPQEFRRWVTLDKFCAGWTNGSSVCKGDSGGGLVFKWVDNERNKIKFYLRGLVSVGPLKEKTCDKYKYGVYTKISSYIKLIKQVVLENKVIIPELFPQRTLTAVNVSACINGEQRCDGQNNCKDESDEVTCDVSTNCRIKNYKICDGVKDCPDGSDESYHICKDIPCPDNAFRCQYGACLDTKVKCNGTEECADGSDEEPTMCGGVTARPTTRATTRYTPPATTRYTTPRTTRQTTILATYRTTTTTTTPTPDPSLTNRACPPLDIVNGDYTVFGISHAKGTPIPNFAMVNISCNSNYGLYPSDSVNHCVNGEWDTHPLQECRQLCPPRISSSVNVTCTLDEIEIDCTKPVVDGTMAESRCNHFYTQSFDDFPISKCSGGSWDSPIIRCEPECGQVIPSRRKRLVGGHDAVKGEFPWHIGLYRFNTTKSTYDYQCGGSIITPLIVITAAQCVTSHLNVKYEAKEFYVAAGKYNSKYDAPEDNSDLVQKRQVKEYRIPRNYRAHYSNNGGDLAVIVVKNAFTLSNVVQPVCVDWNSVTLDQQLRPLNLGNVVGWGFTDPSKLQDSETLKQLTVPYIDRFDCLDVFPQEFLRWVTQDKLCAGWTNGSSVCKGDTGGGLVFKSIDSNYGNNRIKFYLRGLISTFPLKERDCDVYKYGVYTKISSYIQFIREVVSENNVI